MQNPLANRKDEPAFLRHRDESTGRDQPKFGVIEPEQRLESDKAPVTSELRLKVQRKISELDRTMQVRLDFVPVGIFGDLNLGVALHCVSSLGFRTVHGSVSVA